MDYIKEIEERLEKYDDDFIENAEPLGIEYRQEYIDIQNLLKLVKIYEEHLLNGYAMEADLEQTKKQIFEVKK